MKTTKFSNEADWLKARIGKITGSRVGDILPKRGGGRKKGFYELIAERVAFQPDSENPMYRGKRLEDIAIERFSKETGKKVDNSKVLWEREDNSDIAVSPDGVIGKTEAVEVKCLNTASHIEALLTKKIPSEYEDQVAQYFIVNDKLKKLYFIFYDPRMTVKDFFFYEIKRSDLSEKIPEYLEYQKNVLAEVEQIVKDLTF